MLMVTRFVMLLVMHAILVDPITGFAHSSVCLYSPAGMNL